MKIKLYVCSVLRMLRVPRQATGKIKKGKHSWKSRITIIEDKIGVV